MANNNTKRKNIIQGSGASSAQIEHLPVSSLVPYARNSRTHSEKQIAQIAASITEFGFCSPVLIDKDGGIIAGHGRVMAATLLGMVTIPCLRLSHFTEKQRQAYVILDNQLGLNSEWDEATLAAELAELESMEFDLDLLGFEDDCLAGSSDEPDEEVETEAIPQRPVEAITQRGDLWILGDSHRLYCGDSSDQRETRRAAGGWSWDVAIIDPPYEADRASWLKWIMDPCVVFGQVKHLRLIPDSLWRFERVIVKNYSNRSATIQVGHMHAMIAQCGSVKTLPKNKKVTLPSVIYQEVDTEHDHQKPVQLLVDHLTHWTPQWKCVVDPYGGSGSTCLAADKMGKKSVTIELDAGWCDVIVQRWEKATGKTSQRIVNEEVEAYNEAAAGAETPGQPQKPESCKEPSNV